MSSQMIICIVIFVLTLLSYILNKIPMWVASMLSLSALFITGSIAVSYTFQALRIPTQS